MNLESIKAAIRHFESLQKRYTTQHNGRQCAFCDTALAYLRECAEREKGCEFCTPAPNERIEIQCSRIGRTSWPDYETAGRIDGHALCCPKCGRKLERGDT